MIHGKETGLVYQKYLLVAQGRHVSDDWVRDGFHRCSVNYLKLDMGIKIWRHLTHGLMTQFLKKYAPLVSYELQAGHSSMTAQRNYGVSNAQVNSISLEEARLMSLDWQRFLGLSSGASLKAPALDPIIIAPTPSQSLVAVHQVNTPTAAPLPTPAPTPISSQVETSVPFVAPLPLELDSNWSTAKPVCDYSQGTFFFN